MNPQTKAAMLEAFRKFALRISGEYERAYEALERDDFVTAQRILADLAQSHAKTSLSLRNRLIQQGLLEAEK